MIETETNYSKNTPPTPVYKIYCVRPASVRPSMSVRGEVTSNTTAEKADSFLPYNDLYDAVLDEIGTDR